MATIKTFFIQPEISTKDLFIIGAGAFGKRALERLSAKYPNAYITVVDDSDESLSNLHHIIKKQEALYSPPIRTIKGDGVEVLTQYEKIAQPDTWIIPAIPVHVAGEWIVKKLKQKGYDISPDSIPEELRARLPNPFVLEGRNDLLFASIASFICPDNCPEPPEKCTHTGKPRPGNLYEVIAKVIPETRSALIFRSFQLAPGVGGYPALYLMEGLKYLEKLILSPKKYDSIEKNTLSLIIATACRCHGVISAFRLHLG
ncbi:MAG: hypothetical protein WHS38_11540 [Thermodesulforhabdaceae bacterium]